MSNLADLHLLLLQDVFKGHAEMLLILFYFCSALSSEREGVCFYSLINSLVGPLAKWVEA